MAANPVNLLATTLFAPVVALLFLWSSVTRGHYAEGAFVPPQNVHRASCRASLSTERGGRIPPQAAAAESAAPSFHRGVGRESDVVGRGRRNAALSRLTASPDPASTDDAARATTSGKRNVIVVSPPGGVGEIAATSLAKLGHSVRYFVVSSSDDSSGSTSLAFPKRTWDLIEESGGELDVTAGSAESLLLPQDDPRGAGKNLEEWCAVNAVSEAVGGILVSLDDGSDDAAAAGGGGGGKEESARRKELGDAVKLVAQTACGTLPPSATRVEIVPIPSGEDEGGGGHDEGGLKNWLFNPLQSGSSITLREAVSAASSAGGSPNIFTVRHGELFGVPESNKDATPFLGGPRRDPILREEYTQRSVLLSPTAAAVVQRRMGGGESADSVIRTSRLSLADAAVRSLLRDDGAATVGGSDNDDSASVIPRDFAVSSRRGSEPLTEADWTAEFSSLASSKARTVDGEGSLILFETSYDDVPNVAKLADWIAFKWAPTVLSTYDIAGIRKGARPVYATRVPSGGEGGKKEEEEEVVEIYWQELINFEETKTVGKMIIRVSDGGMVATRKALLAGSSGEGVLSPAKPFPGESVLVRRLADAAGQAAEKGLAVKRKVAKPGREAKIPTPTARTPATGAVTPSGSVLEETSKATTTTATVSKERRRSSDTGPRTSGAKRSSERRRGKRSADRPGKKKGGK